MIKAKELFNEIKQDIENFGIRKLNEVAVNENSIYVWLFDKSTCSDDEIELAVYKNKEDFEIYSEIRITDEENTKLNELGKMIKERF